MNVCKVKKNSMMIPRKLIINNYQNINDNNIEESNLYPLQFNKNDKIDKSSNKLYLKSNYKIKKNNNYSPDSLEYIKSVPTHIVKKQFYITPSKIETKKSIIKIPQDIKTDKNEDSLSTFPLTKENMIITPKKNENLNESEEKQKINQRSLSCAQRNKNKLLKDRENMVFVKKRIQGSLKNSFIYTKSDSDFHENNSCCYFGEYPQPHINFNPNNSMDYGRSNYYNENYMNIINNLDTNHGCNSVLITNNNINLITNNNYISSNNKEIDNYNENNTLRSNNSVSLRSNNHKKYNKIRVIKTLKNKNNMIKKSPRSNSNIINYLDHLNMNLKSPVNYNLITKDNNYYNLTREKDIQIRNNNINYMLMNKKLNKNLDGYSHNNSWISDSLLKEINFEDIYLLIQKFDIIKNNIVILGNLKYTSNKQLFENINMIRIFIYDLYKFFLGSSIEGCPQNLFSEKNSKLYLQFYSVILILSLGLMYVITHKIKMTRDYQDKLLVLINLQLKAFLIFCDSLIKKIYYNIDYDNNKDIWINKIIDELDNRKILYTTNHILRIKVLSIDSYKMFNKMIINIYASNGEKILSKKNEQETFLYRHFYNKTINYLAQIKINELEEIFDRNIFKIINLRSNFANITSLKGNNLSNNSPDSNNKIHNKLNSTDFYFKNGSKNNNNYNKYEFKIKPIISLNKNKIKSHQKNKSGMNPVNFLKSLRVKEPYLDFPPLKEYTLVLDLDETMISFQFTHPHQGIGQMHLRPGLENFLDVIKEYYEIIVFTSGTRDYADMVLDVIEHKKQKKFFSGRLYREHTTRIGKKYIKDLSKLGRDLSRTLIVDNLPQSFKFQHENGILISSFYADENDKKDDRALIELQKILIKIYEDKKDVRLSILKYKEEIIRNVSCLDLR